MTEAPYNTPGEPSTTEVLIGLHHNLGWLKDFIRLRGDVRDKPPRDEELDELCEYIERAARRLSTPPPSTPAVGSL